jgi:hypothetical protein
MSRSSRKAAVNDVRPIMKGINWLVVFNVYTPDTLLDKMVNSIKTMKHAIDARVVAWNRMHADVRSRLDEISNFPLTGRKFLVLAVFSSHAPQRLLTPILDSKKINEPQLRRLEEATRPS